MKFSKDQYVECVNASNVRYKYETIKEGTVYKVVDTGIDGDCNEWIEVSLFGSLLNGIYNVNRFTPYTPYSHVETPNKLNTKLTNKTTPSEKLFANKTNITDLSTAKSVNHDTIFVDFANKKVLGRQTLRVK